MLRLYRLFPARRIAFYLPHLFCGLLMLGLCAPDKALARKDTAFTVENVKVDITAENAAAAREQAFAKAQEQAFQLLANRLLSENERAYFEMPDTETIATLVKDFEVTNERLSDIRYIGTFTFRFKDDATRNYLAYRGFAYTDVTSKPVLILPFYQWGSRSVLWHDNNPWRAAWNRLPSYQGLVPVITPIGDLQDVSDIGDDQALIYNKQNLQNMQDRYGAGDTFIVIAQPQWHGSAQTNSPPDELVVTIYKTDDRGPAFVQQLYVAAHEVPPGGSIFQTAAEKTRDTLQSDWKQRTLVTGAEDNRLKARVKFRSMNEWIETQQALRRVQGVNDINLLSLNPQEAQVEILFQGDERRLRLALAQADMTLTMPHLGFPQATPPGYDYGYEYGYNTGASPLIYDLYLNKFKPQNYSGRIP